MTGAGAIKGKPISVRRLGERKVNIAATKWLDGWSTLRIAKYLQVKESTIYNSIDRIKWRAKYARRPYPNV